MHRAGRGTASARSRSPDRHQQYRGTAAGSYAYPVLVGWPRQRVTVTPSIRVPTESEIPASLNSSRVARPVARTFNAYMCQSVLVRPVPSAVSVATTRLCHLTARTFSAADVPGRGQKKSWRR